MARGHLTKRSEGTWSLVIELPADPDTGKRRQKWVTFRGPKRDAEKELTRLQADADQGKLGLAPKLTVGDYLEQWLREQIEPNMAPRTIILYRQLVRRYMIPAIGKLPLDKLKATDIVAMHAGVRHLSAETRRSIIATLHAALKAAVRWKLIVSNPCDAVERPKVKQREIRALSPDEARRLLDALAGESVYWQAYFTLAMTTGLRLGELRALRWQDIDLAKRSLSVMLSAQRIPGQRVVTRAPKTDSSRRKVMLGVDVVALLKSHRAAQNEARLAAGAEWRDLGLVFHGRNGYYLEEFGMRKTFARILDRAGLPHMRFHDLRHTAATLLLTAGVHPKVVSERLGHSTVTMTLKTYSHVSETLQQQAADTLNELLANR